LAYDHDEGLVRLLATAEQRLARTRGFERCVRAREGEDPASRKRKASLEVIYPDARLRGAIDHYAGGRLAEAAQALKRVLVDSRRRSLQGQASSLRHDVQRIEGYMKRMRELERSGDLMMALRQWGLIQKLDHELLKGQVESRVVVDTRTLLTGFLLKRATERRGQKRYKEALSDLRLAQQVDPSSVQVTTDLKKLAAEAPGPVVKDAKALLKKSASGPASTPSAKP
jgi:hypothetical protein